MTKTKSLPEAGDITYYAYTPQNQLCKVTDGAGKVKASYTYNAEGLRISKTVDGVVSKQVYNGQNIVAELNAQNAVTAKYNRGLGLISRDKDGEKMYYLMDGHGSVIRLTNQSGNVQENYHYDAFGNEQRPNANHTNPFRYCGEYFDKETGNLYLRARYYNSQNGRFTTEDPAFDGLNWYVYCENNPITKTDPSGKRSVEEAQQIIYENRQYIKDAAKEFGVNPAILAACIYAEQVLNVDWVDDVTDLAGYTIDTSIGVAQVKISTAKMLEDAGYMEVTEEINNNMYPMSRESLIAGKLTDPKTNIRYAAAYLAYFQDRWKEAYPEIDGRTAILATLYNQGEKRPPHANPESNPFGDFAKENYYLMQNILYDW